MHAVYWREANIAHTNHIPHPSHLPQWHFALYLLHIWWLGDLSWEWWCWNVASRPWHQNPNNRNILCWWVMETAPLFPRYTLHVWQPSFPSCTQQKQGQTFLTGKLLSWLRPIDATCPAYTILQGILFLLRECTVTLQNEPSSFGPTTMWSPSRRTPLKT